MTDNDPFRYENHLVGILNDANGKLVGRTRMQKINYILEVAGLGVGFPFEYKHYGPYSAELTSAIDFAKMFAYLKEDEHETAWGGWYSVFTLPENEISEEEQVFDEGKRATVRKDFVGKMKDVSSIDLELAATALFLHREGEPHPWAKTAELKPTKATKEHLLAAKNLYTDLLSIDGMPELLPKLSCE